MSKSLIGDPDETRPIPQLPDEESDMLTGTASEYTVCQPPRPSRTLGCNGGPGEPVCSGFGYRPHQAGRQCPTPPTPTDPMYSSLTSEEQANARAYWLNDILEEMQELRERRFSEYGL